MEEKREKIGGGGGGYGGQNSMFVLPFSARSNSMEASPSPNVGGMGDLCCVSAVSHGDESIKNIFY